MFQKIIPFLWFEDKCEEAINYYIDTFNNAPAKNNNSKVNFIQRYEKGMKTPGNDKMLGKILTAEFELDGQKFQALDGGPVFKFNESISLLVNCKNQKEVDYFWEKLSAVPESEQCGWCKDKFGLSWQIIPNHLGVLIDAKDKKKSHNVVNAMLQMKKIDIKTLEKAYKVG
jgi:predicted 3-demethylubiquinone-9 3-methyltransferase (glyoxalase superfamily)